jgi:hypothetical protein
MEISLKYEGNINSNDITYWFESKKYHPTNNLIILPYHYNDEWGDPEQYSVKKLKGFLNQIQKEFTISEDTLTLIKYPFHSVDYSSLKIHIIFNVNLMIYSMTFFQTIFNEILNTDILSEIDNICLHLLLCLPDNFDYNEIEKMIENQSKIKIHICKNISEYYSISYLYELLNDDDDYILYYHISNDKLLFRYLVYDWKWCLFIFKHFLSINKIGIHTNKDGYLFFNSWWVRVSYLKKLEKPIYVKNNLYYQNWICRKPHIKKDDIKNELLLNSENYDLSYIDCWNLYRIISNIGYYVDSFEYTNHKNEELNDLFIVL